MKLRILHEIRVHDAALCANDCPCHAYDADVEMICGAFGVDLEPSDAEDSGGNGLAYRCDECKRAEREAGVLS